MKVIMCEDKLKLILTILAFSKECKSKEAENIPMICIVGKSHMRAETPNFQTMERTKK